MSTSLIINDLNVNINVNGIQRQRMMQSILFFLLEHRWKTLLRRLESLRRQTVQIITNINMPISKCDISVTTVTHR
jgi:hypothetical protein